MKRTTTTKPSDELRDEYDLSRLAVNRALRILADAAQEATSSKRRRTR